LKQLAFATQQHLDKQRAFPPGNEGNNHSWAPFLLPYLELESILTTKDVNPTTGQTVEVELYHWELPWNDPANRESITTPVPMFVCPSTTRPADELAASGNVQAAVTDYVPTAGVDKRQVYDSGTVPPPPGAGNNDFLPYPPPIPASESHLPGVIGFVTAQGTGPKKARIQDIKDGTSNTMLFIEDAGRPELWTINGFVGPTGAAHAGWADPGNNLYVHTLDALTLMAPGPCVINCTNDDEAFSFHSDGVTAVFADNSVHFLQEEMAPQVFVSLITRDGGEIVSQDAF
jgi:hypothetical protein